MCVGLNKQLSYDIKGSYLYFKKSLDIWLKLDDAAFILITAK